MEYKDNVSLIFNPIILWLMLRGRLFFNVVVTHFTWLNGQTLAKTIRCRFETAAIVTQEWNCGGENQADYNYIVMQITDIVWGGWSEYGGACWTSTFTSLTHFIFPLHPTCQGAWRRFMEKFYFWMRAETRPMILVVTIRGVLKKKGIFVRVPGPRIVISIIMKYEFFV